MSSHDHAKDLRSARMGRVRQRNTRPELAVRRLLYRQDFRFPLHALTLPVRPVFVFRSRRKVILVHGVSGTTMKDVIARQFQRLVAITGSPNLRPINSAIALRNQDWNN